MSYIVNLKRPEELELYSVLIFEFDDKEEHVGVVHKNSSTNNYYLECNEGYNSAVFKKLGLDKVKFVQDIVGYDLGGDWPETRTLEEMSKVLDALLKVNKPIEEPVEETIKPPSEWDWLLC